MEIEHLGTHQVLFSEGGQDEMEVGAVQQVLVRL